VRRKLVNTRKRMESILNKEPVELEPGEWYDSEQELAQPLLACYWSLWECGAGVIANGRLLDLIRRVFAFGMSLLKLDLRQESTRHADTMDAITTYLGYGSYKEWDEEKRQAWLTQVGGWWHHG
jgi:phosphoenolpyruvate carboxylase